MQIELNKVNLLYHNGLDFEAMSSLKPLSPFSPTVCSFLSDLSRVLRSETLLKNYPELGAFSFFCRKSNIEKMKSRYHGTLENRIGRGVTFHIAPSNVPIQFAYSMVTGLLSGNSCVVRASSKQFQQTEIICNAIKKVFENREYDLLKNYISIITYDRDNEITSYFSSLCDIRIIWGGDNTINQIRKTAIPPRSFDITFADRYSISVINADEYLNKFDPKKTAQCFYNDTYFYDQNACSSPSLVVWYGNADSVTKAKEVFWDALYEYAKNRYSIESSIAIEKLIAVCRSAISLNNTHIEKMPDNLINRIRVDSLSPEITDFRCAGGSFIEYQTEDLETLKNIITRKYQTLAYIGFSPEHLRNIVIEQGFLGIDRIVPVGKTGDFTLIWDGYDLILTMTRIVDSSK